MTNAVCFDSLQFLTYVGMVLPGLNQVADKVSCSMTKHLTPPVVRLELATFDPQSNTLPTKQLRSANVTIFCVYGTQRGELSMLTEQYTVHTYAACILIFIFFFIFSLKKSVEPASRHT